MTEQPSLLDEIATLVETRAPSARPARAGIVPPVDDEYARVADAARADWTARIAAARARADRPHEETDHAHE